MSTATRNDSSGSRRIVSGLSSHVLHRIYVTIFLWTALVLVCAAGAVAHDRHDAVGRFIATSVSALVAGLIACFAMRTRSTALPGLLFAVGAALSLSPTLAFDESLRQRSVVLDLFYVLLISAPAFLTAWTWRWQVALSVSAVCSVWALNSAQSAASMFHAGTLSAIAGVLSSLVVFIKGWEGREDAGRPISASDAAIEKRELPAWTRQTLVCQAAIVAGAIVFDTWLGYDELSSAVLPKVYGLMVLVFGALFATVAGASVLPWAIIVTTAGVIGSFSVARFGYEWSAIACVIPAAAILCSTSLMRWTVERQLALVWLSLLLDAGIKAAWRRQSEYLPTFTEIGLSIERFRQENLLLLASAALSVWLASTLRRQHFGGIVRVLHGSTGDEALDDASANRLHAIPDTHHEGLVPERNRRLLFSLFLLGICSNAMGSRIVSQHVTGLSGLALLAWIFFLVFWGLLVQQERRSSKWPHLWPLGALLALILFAWPLLLLLSLDRMGHLWLWWPLGILLSIGAIPWHLKELIPLFGVEAVLGVELVVHRGIAEEGALVCAGSALLAVLVSRRLARELRARVLLTRFHARLSSTSTETDVLRILADSLGGLVEGGMVFFSRQPGHFEVVGDGLAYDPGRELISLRSLRREIGRFEINPMGVGVATVQVVSDASGDELGGFFGSRRGVLLELRMRDGSGEPVEQSIEAHPGQSRSGEDILFLTVASSSLQLLFAGEMIAVAEILASAAKMRLLTILKDQARRRAITEAELQVSQREYELSALVHDINNTVQDLTLLCELIQESLPPASDGGLSEVPQRVKRIAVLARSVATVVSDAKRRRELERIEDLSPRELVEVTSVVADLSTFATVRAERKRIMVEPPQLADAEVWVRVSVREHLETILRNLLNNAITYCSPGSTIRMSVRADEQWASIEVSDNGPGLTAEECESVFRPGVRGSTASGVQGGLGVGLAESRRVAESAGGSITATSDGPGKGATFTVTLPRQRVAPATDTSLSWALLVDDQPTLTDFYSRIARAFHLVPEVASSVPEAIDVLERRGRPTLVMTDIHLGASDGLDLVRKIRSDYGLSVPVVVISGLTSEDVVQRARAAGATDFVPKPVGRRALYARIQSLLV